MDGMHGRDEYQLMEQHGIQELVKVSFDEEGLPCIFLSSVERVFPNTAAISSHGVRIPFAKGPSNIPKQPLRIPYIKIRVLCAESDTFEWLREATAVRIAAAAAAVAEFTTIPNTVHTAPIPGILDLDLDSYMEGHRTDDDVNTGNEDYFDMAESELPSDGGEQREAEAEQEEEEGEGSLSRHMPLTSTAATLGTTATSPASTTQTLRTVHSLTNVVFELPPIPTVHTLLLQDALSAFEAVVSTLQTPASVAATAPPPAPAITSSHHHAMPEEPEEHEEVLSPPSYEPIDTDVHQNADPPEHPRATVPAIDDPTELRLVHDRMEIIKRISQTILAQRYEAESCPHPPLFIILPENPLQWSFDNILHNKMRLYFLCDCCEHEIRPDDSHDEQQRFANRRNVHVEEGKGFDIRLDQFQDQMLLMKFGHYILNLLRMLQYGVSLDDIFVAPAFDHPVPALISASGTIAVGRDGLDPQLFFKLRRNVEKSIAFMETLLEDAYEGEATHIISRLDMDDFRILDYIVKRSPYAQSAKTESSSKTNSSSSPTTTMATDADRELAMDDVHLGGSGLCRVLDTNGRARWVCWKFYKLNHQNSDKILANKLEHLQTTLDFHMRSSSFSGSDEDQLNKRIIAVSKVKALFRVDVMLDWDFETNQLGTLAESLEHDATTVSTVAIRLSKRVPPLAWKRTSQAEDDQQPISAVINMIQNRNIKHLILEGDIDLISVPDIGSMDFANLDILSIMKTNNRDYLYSNNGSNIVSSSGSSVYSNDNIESGILSTSNRALTQETYIPGLMSFMQSCRFLTELSLGFPDAIPGHVRILQACATGQPGLRRLDLFRVLGTKVFGDSGQGGSVISRKLELSASLSASKTTRLYLAECKATGDHKTKLLESLEELLTDDGSSLEDLELRFIGFNDKHAHALELGTRPLSGDSHCRLRRLVIHGKGLEQRGVSALRRVLKRATQSHRFSGAFSLDGVASRGNSNGVGSSSSEIVVPATAPTPLPVEDPRSLSFGAMWEQPTLTHLELCSIDSLTDSDWASLLSDLNPQRLITIDLQGVFFGDRAVAMLARTGNINDALDSSSSPLSPLRESSAIASSPPSAPPAFFSSSSPLHLQSLRLSCSVLSHKGVGHLQEFLSRLIHLSSISLHGFRKVSSENWIDIMARIEFRWLEVIDIMSSGYDDACARYLGERLRAREQMPETVATTVVSLEEVDEPELPTYIAQIVPTESSSSSITTAISGSASSITPRVSRRISLSSRLLGAVAPSSTPNPTAIEFTTKQKIDDTDKRSPTLSATASSGIRPSPSQKYLEIDLRYTDITTKGLTLLRRSTIGQAKKVVIRLRDGEDEDEVNQESMDEIARLTAKLKGDKEYEDNQKSNGKRRAVPLSPTFGSIAESHSGIGSGNLYTSSSSSPYGPGNGTANNGGSNNTRTSQSQQLSKSLTFTKLKGVFKKH